MFGENPANGKRTCFVNVLAKGTKTLCVGMFGAIGVPFFYVTTWIMSSFITRSVLCITHAKRRLFKVALSLLDLIYSVDLESGLH